MARKEKKNVGVIVIGIFLVILMVGSLAGIIGVFSEDPAATNEFNGIPFVQTAQGWVAQFDGGSQVLFAVHPSEVAALSIPTDFSGWNQYGRVYVSASPSSQMAFAATEVQRFRSVFGFQSVIPSCPEDSESCELNNYPVRTCADASEDVGVIIFKESTTADISLDGSCLTVAGSALDAVRYVDRAAYQRLGVL